MALAGGQSLDRSADEAVQLQEAAMRVGYGAAALPLWEEFLLRYFIYQACTFCFCQAMLHRWRLCRKLDLML